MYKDKHTYQRRDRGDYIEPLWINMWSKMMQIFINLALSLVYPYGALTSRKKLEKTNERSPRYLKTDYGPTDQRTRAITKDPLGRTRNPK